MSALIYALAGGGTPLVTLSTQILPSTQPVCFASRGLPPKEANISIVS
ncbi:hypothetical protein GCM10008955_42380 [Deinococcus malanensis]|uniref:Uncharacterized protein n=1 Tax=Deinococcus malanensis TaxID=1706855 RepID=A0ABQ2F2X7_9DEIO|nr:hypothetical protein GCM10008955_42380 [Deinococcus malanensis]